MEWVSVVSLIVSVVGTFFAIRQSNRALSEAKDHGQRILAIEEGRDRESAKQAGRAVIKVALWRRSIETGWTKEPGKSLAREARSVVIKNEGPGEARDLEIQLDDKPASDWLRSTQKMPDLNTPMKPHAEIYIDLHPFDRSPSRAKVTWVDDSGSPGLIETDLR